MTTTRHDQSKQNQAVVSTRSLMDHKVYDKENKLIGTVSDVVFEATHGLLAYVRIRLNDQRILIVPYDAIELNPSDAVIRIKMYRQAIEQIG